MSDQVRARIPLAAVFATLAAMLCHCLGPVLRVALESPLCAPMSPWWAQIGVHLDLVAADSACRAGAADVGPALAHARTLMVTLSLGAVLYFLTAVAVSLGLRACVRRLAHNVRDWMATKLSPVAPLPAPALAAHPLRVITPHAWVRRGHLAATYHGRRGPPLGFAL